MMAMWLQKFAMMAIQKQRLILRLPDRFKAYFKAAKKCIFNGSRFARLLSAVVVTAVITIAYICLHAEYQIDVASDRIVMASEQNQTILAQHFAQHLVREMDERSRLLLLMRNEYARMETDALPVSSSDTSAAFLQRFAAVYGGLYSALSLIDISGRVVASTGSVHIRASDASSASLYLAHRDDSLWIAQPSQSPQTCL